MPNQQDPIKNDHFIPMLSMTVLFSLFKNSGIIISLTPPLDKLYVEFERTWSLDFKNLKWGQETLFMKMLATWFGGDILLNYILFSWPSKIAKGSLGSGDGALTLIRICLTHKVGGKTKKKRRRKREGHLKGLGQAGNRTKKKKRRERERENGKLS